MSRQLELINSLVADGREEFTFADAKSALGVSTPATANALRQLTQKGLVNRLTRGHYAIRPLGSLGTSTATDDLSAVIGAAFEGRSHRISYCSALSELGLVSHPVRTLYVACTHQVRFTAVSARPLHSLIETPATIHLEAEAVGSSWRSSLERALFESALRMDLTGSVELLAEALTAGSRDVNPTRIAQLATVFGGRGRAAERRLASLTHALHLPLALTPNVAAKQPLIRLNPKDDSDAWTDTRYRVIWNATIDELQAVVGN